MAGDLSKWFDSTISAIQMMLIQCGYWKITHNHWSRHVVPLVTLAIRNAFNPARWTGMLCMLQYTLKIPSYLLRIVDLNLRNSDMQYDVIDGHRLITDTSRAI